MANVLTCSVVWVLAVQMTGFVGGHSPTLTTLWTYCPDNTVCPGGQTCLRLRNGSYGCCPYHEASECSDELHCCPQGSHCHVSSGTCVQGNMTVAMVRNHPSINVDAANTGCRKPPTVVCPNHQTCPEGTKCCRDAEATVSYYCCTYEKGHCCPGGMFCCDEGYRCDLTRGLCYNNVTNKTSPNGAMWSMRSSAKPSLRKQPPREAARAEIAEFNQCPDGTSCYSDSSCCAVAKDNFACCPFLTSECSDDENLCCLEGFNYNATGNNCVNKQHVVPAAKKYPSFMAPKLTIDTCKYQQSFDAFLRSSMKNSHSSLRLDVLMLPGFSCI